MKYCLPGSCCQPYLAVRCRKHNPEGNRTHSGRGFAAFSEAADAARADVVPYATSKGVTGPQRPRAPREARRRQRRRAAGTQSGPALTDIAGSRPTGDHHSAGGRTHTRAAAGGADSSPQAPMSAAMDGGVDRGGRAPPERHSRMPRSPAAPPMPRVPSSRSTGHPLA